MKLLEKYLYQVGRHLPKSDREDTINELQSIILDQLDEKISAGSSEEDALTSIITELGDPRSVAFRYRNMHPLMKRELEQIMWTVIKIPAIAVPLVLLIVRTVDFITNTTDFTIMDLSSEVMLKDSSPISDCLR